MLSPVLFEMVLGGCQMIDFTFSDLFNQYSYISIAFVIILLAACVSRFTVKHDG